LKRLVILSLIFFAALTASTQTHPYGCISDLDYILAFKEPVANCYKNPGDFYKKMYELLNEQIVLKKPDSLLIIDLTTQK
jgi:hypothetical protein